MTGMSDRADAIRSYWNEQASEYGERPEATTNDVWLRHVEIAALSGVLGRLPDGSTVLDIGCGNGWTTIRLAREHRHSFLGVDYADGMISHARAALVAESKEVKSRVQFDVGEVRDLSAMKPKDVVISDRCLINLTSWELQQQAMEQVARVLKPGGLFLVIENFVQGQAHFDEQRRAVGLDPIPVRWHNLPLDEDRFLSAAARNFELVNIDAVSSLYYLVTRVVYSKLCVLDGTEPSYEHPICEIAAQLPHVGDFGPVKMFELRRRASVATMRKPLGLQRVMLEPLWCFTDEFSKVVVDGRIIAGRVEKGSEDS